MKSTFVIETPRIPRGRATTIKIHSIPPPPFAPRLIPFISPPRDSKECVCVRVFAHHVSVLPRPLKWLDGGGRRRGWRERGELGATFSRTASFYITGKLESKRRPC